MKIQAGKEKVTIIPATLTRNTPGKSANQKLRVAAYCRVSTDSEEQINTLTKISWTYYTEKINSKTEWKFAGIYADEGITGTSIEAPGGLQTDAPGLPGGTHRPDPV